MRIGILGAGGVGGYFGGRLAKAGHAVTFVARGAHGAALQAEGLTVESPLGDFSVKPVTVVERPEALGPQDVVLNCVKLWDLEASGRALATSGIGRALVIPIQNGVEAARILTGALPDRQVAQGIAYIPAEILRPGAIRHNGRFAKLAFGARHASQRAVIGQLVQALHAAGVEAAESGNIELDLWRKFLMLSTLASVTALKRQPIGAIRSTPEGSALIDALIAEAAAVGRASGVVLPEGIEAETRRTLDALPDHMRASMAQDLEKGGRLELPWLAGAVQRLAAAHNVCVARTKEVVEALAPFQMGRNN